jgi:hypothetical protein
MILPMLRRVLWFTAIGWVTLLLIGPVLTVIGTLIPFALLGGAVWLVWWGATRTARHFRLATVQAKLAENRVLPAVGRGAREIWSQGIRRGKNLGPAVCEGACLVGRGAGKVFQEGIHHCRAAAPVLGERAWLVGRGAGRAFQGGIHHCREAAPVLCAQGRRMRARMASFLRAATRIVVEVTCGAVVGGLVAWCAVGTTEETVAIGALVGAALGFVVGGSKREPVRELATGE